LAARSYAQTGGEIVERLARRRSRRRGEVYEEVALAPEKRRSNDAICELARRAGRREVLLSFVCECSRQSCVAPIAVPVAAYEAFRCDDRHRLIAPDHLWQPRDETLIARTSGYWVIADSTSAPSETGVSAQTLGWSREELSEENKQTAGAAGQAEPTEPSNPRGFA